MVRDLARSLPDEQIARILNRLGNRTGRGSAWTKSRLTTLRNTHGIAVFGRAATAAVLLTMDQAAAAVGVSPMTIRRLILRKLLPATQPVPYAPWAIRRADLELDAVQRAIMGQERSRLPPPAADMQLTLVDSAT